MFGIFRQTRSDPTARLLLLAGIIVQLLFCVTATGVYHTDQHFQIVEFATWKLGEPSGVTHVWEFTHHVRPTVQIWMFAGWHSLLRLFGTTDPYMELTLLRVIVGLLLFFLFNGLLLYYLRDYDRKVRCLGLLLLNFAWFLPYTRTLFSSEMMSASAFFGAAWWYDSRKDRARFGELGLIGLLLALSFYLRFQTGFLIAALGIWMLLEKKFRHLLPLLLGFLAGIASNIGLDYLFYGYFVFTPYEYFAANIFVKRAASFGTSSVFHYVAVLLALVPVIPLSLILFYYAVRPAVRQWKHWLVLGFVFFFVGHSLVGHKEERFMFPVLNVLPVLVAWGWPQFVKSFQRARLATKTILRSAIVISMLLNAALLAALLFTPYSQTIHYTRKLHDRFRDTDITSIYTLDRTPFETPSRVPFRFYEKGFMPRFVKLNVDSVRRLRGQNLFFTTTYEQLPGLRPALDSMGFRPVMYSSRLLWQVNEFLHRQGIHTINDIWVLYRN